MQENAKNTETEKVLRDDEAKKKIRSQLSKRKSFIKTAEAHRATEHEHYESINAAAMYLHDRLNIVPKYIPQKKVSRCQKAIDKSESAQSYHTVQFCSILLCLCCIPHG